MTSNDIQRGVLLIGKSQLVLDEAVAGLRNLGYNATGTNDFSDVSSRFDVKKIELVVFGGQVPPDRKVELREEITAINPQIMFVQGLSGIPGLIVDQVRGAFAAEHPDFARAPTFGPDDRTIWLTLANPADVKVTAWWPTSFVPPDPKSESLVLLDEHLAEGDHTIPLPEHIPPHLAFATVQLDTAIHTFSIATEHTAGPAPTDG